MSESKTCFTCKQIKALSEFRNLRRSKDGKATYCRDCAREKLNAYRKANPDIVKAAKKRWYNRHAEERKTYARQFRQNNPE
jgi:3-methyladenine DNA glycosylase AlkC